MKKRLLTVCLAGILVLASSVTALAEDRQGASGWQVRFDGKKMESNFTSANMGDEINAMQPGDSVELTITLKNQFNGEADWYMKNEVLKTLEDAGNAAGGAYDYLLTYTDTAGELTTLYSSEKFGGEGRINGVGLHGATHTLDDYFYLDRMGDGEGGTVKLTVALDGETLVNNYQNTYARLQMDFATEIVKYNTTPPRGSGNRQHIIKTGDHTDMIKYIVLMLGAGLVLLFVVFFRLRNDQEEEEETGTGNGGGASGSRRRQRVIHRSLVFLSAVTTSAVVAVSVGQTVSAADPEYTYTVRLYAGNQGELTGIGIDAPGAVIEPVTGSNGKVDQMVVSGLRYGQEIYIYPNMAAKVTDERYYVKGIRRSGRDNSEAVASAGNASSDMDYVIAYGIRGDMAAYTVNYVDTAGNELLPSDTYYGNIGERQYVSARYVDGYRPEAYNMVKTLSANEAENVFDFVYTEGTGTVAGDTPGTTSEGTAPDGTGTDDGTGAADGGDAGAADGADAGTGGEDGAGGQEPIGGDMVSVQDEEVPLGLKDLDGGKDIPIFSQGIRLGYMPFYIGIAGVAMLALFVAFLYLKRQKDRAIGSDKSSQNRRKLL